MAKRGDVRYLGSHAFVRINEGFTPFDINAVVGAGPTGPAKRRRAPGNDDSGDDSEVADGRCPNGRGPARERNNITLPHTPQYERLCAVVRGIRALEEDSAATPAAGRRKVAALRELLAEVGARAAFAGVVARLGQRLDEADVYYTFMAELQHAE